MDGHFSRGTVISTSESKPLSHWNLMKLSICTSGILSSCRLVYRYQAGQVKLSDDLMPERHQRGEKVMQSHFKLYDMEN